MSRGHYGALKGLGAPPPHPSRSFFLSFLKFKFIVMVRVGVFKERVFLFCFSWIANENANNIFVTGCLKNDSVRYAKCKRGI